MQTGSVVAERYRIARVIGRGGMAVVYEAHDEWTGGSVAVKVVRRGMDRVDRFFREVRAAARLQSDFVCPLLDVGTLDEGRSYLVMPLLHGMPLRKLLEETSPLPLPLALTIEDQVLAALEDAHAAGIVHRDLKPENVFLLDATQPHFVKVLDFGIARVAGDPGAPGTVTGQAIGTAQYMAPEQARGQRDQDARVDIWAAGVLLYEMLTGARPFDGGSYGETLAHVLFDPFVPPRARSPELPEAVEAFILRALQRERTERFHDARSMRESLAMLPGSPAPAPRREATIVDELDGWESATDPGDSDPTLQGPVAGSYPPPTGERPSQRSTLYSDDLDRTPPDGSFLPDLPTKVGDDEDD